MSTIDLPPGIGLQGIPLATFRAPARARRLATLSLVSVIVLGAITWTFVFRRSPYTWYRTNASTQVVLPFALFSIAMIGFLVRRARIAVTRDGVRWGWDALNFTQDKARIVKAHVFTDGVAFEPRSGSKWFIAARDWERFDAFVRFLRRAELPVQEYDYAAPLRARLQSYGRFLDAMLIASVVSALAVMLWAA